MDVNQFSTREIYINARRGERDTLADQSYAIAETRSSRTSGAPSEPVSSNSSLRPSTSDRVEGAHNLKGGSDEDTKGEIRLRIGNDEPVTLSLNGDMEGRILQLVPMENGMNELVISGNGRSDSRYRSERGSIRKAITPASQARRDAEMPERSSISSRQRGETRGEQIEPRRVPMGLPRRSRRERQEADAPKIVQEQSNSDGGTPLE